MRSNIISSAVLAIAAATRAGGVRRLELDVESRRRVQPADHGGPPRPPRPRARRRRPLHRPRAPQPRPRPPAGPPVCRAAGLELTFLGGQGATGHGELGFALQEHRQSTSCNTVGYPGIQFLGRSGAPLPTTPTHTTSDFFGYSAAHGSWSSRPGQTVSFRLGVDPRQRLERGLHDRLRPAGDPAQRHGDAARLDPAAALSSAARRPSRRCRPGRRPTSSQPRQ